MSSISHTITIERPIEDVFGVLTDVEKSAAWFPAEIEERWTSPPPHGVGSTRHAVVTMFGRRSENDAVVAEYDPPRRARIRGTSRNAPFDATLDFEATASGTRVVVTIAIDLRGPMRLLGRPFLGWYGRSWKRGLANLKDLMESGRL